MIILRPNYYDKFFCIADRCKKNCCNGWALEVDEETHRYYCSIEGAFGDKLREHLKNMEGYETEGGSIFALEVDGACPFLNEKGLCEIVLNLGEESLCEICATYPRSSFEYEECRELFLTPSCEEAARLMLEEKEPGFIKEKDREESEEYYFLGIRETCLAILQKEKESLKEKCAIIYGYLKDIQEAVNQRVVDYKRIKNISPTGDDSGDLAGFIGEMEECIPPREERILILGNLEPMDSDFSLIQRQLGIYDFSGYGEGDGGVCDTFASRVFTYYLLRYLPEAFYDNCYIEKFKFAMFCLYSLYDLSLIKGDGKMLNRAGEIELLSDFSRTLEHSEDNMDYCFECLL